MKLDPKVFKAYDVRGPVPEAFDAEGAGRVAMAFVRFLREEVQAPTHPVVVVGHDARPSSEDIVIAVVEHLKQVGAKVVRLGPATSPMFYYAVNHLDADGGIMVTASHNPLPDNGLKMVRRSAVAIGAGQGMERIQELALGSDSLQFDGPAGDAFTGSVLDEYTAFLLSHASIERPLKIAIDAGNGMAPVVLNELLPRLENVTTERLFFEIDMTFPNHEANPIKESTLEELKKTVLAKGADMGIAFDGDADRVGFVTAEGKVVRCDMIIALLAEDILRRSGKRETIGLEVKSSKVVEEVVRENGGEPKRIPTGHAAANKMLRECDGAMAGELSCHFFFRETAYRDGAILAALKVLSLVSQHGPLAELVAPFEARYVQTGEVNYRVADKQAAIARVEAAFPDATITRIDGITMEFQDWWFNLRTSNTEDVIRLNAEATSQSILDEHFPQVEALIGGEKE